MASRDFELEYSSDENTLEHIEAFRAVDQPIISHPFPFDTDDSSSESCGPYTCDTESQSGLSTPSTPGTPSTSLGTAFSFVGLSSQQTSEEETFVTPKPKRKKPERKARYNFKKGHIPYKRRIVETHLGGILPPRWNVLQIRFTATCAFRVAERAIM